MWRAPSLTAKPRITLCVNIDAKTTKRQKTCLEIEWLEVIVAKQGLLDHYE